MGFEKILFTNGAMLSEKNIFFTKPRVINVIPNLRFVFVITNCFKICVELEFEIFSLSCGKKLLARNIGPATSGGKNATKMHILLEIC